MNSELQSKLNENELQVLSFIIMDKARQLTANLPRFRDMGLERVVELIENWLVNGEATIIEDPIIDGWRLVLRGENE